MGGKGSSRWNGYTRSPIIEETPELGVKNLMEYYKNFENSSFKPVPFYLREEKTYFKIDGGFQKALDDGHYIKISGYFNSHSGNQFIRQNIELCQDTTLRESFIWRLICPSCGDHQSFLYLPFNEAKIMCRFEHGLLYQSSLKSGF